MAPPSFGPPGYTIPQRFMNRTPPPDGADTNTRPYMIFFSYMLTCFGVSVFIIQRIVKKHWGLKKSTTANLPPGKDVWLFSALAASSLLTTWTFMFKYFNVSYKTWLMWRSYYELDPHQRHWGLWLEETSLFHEAWELVVVGNARYWWSHQIFFFALGLGLYMEQKGMPLSIFEDAVDADLRRRETRHQAHMGLYASWSNRGHQLRHEPVFSYFTSEPDITTSAILKKSAVKLVRPMAPQSGVRPRNRSSGVLVGR
jgi:hypothetical protein